jgi:hypothetical protein
MKLTLAAVILPLWSESATAQSQWPVQVDARATDSVGKAFVYNLKEAIGHSATYKLVDDNPTSLVLHIVTMSTTDDTENNPNSVISVVLVLKDKNVEYYDDNWVVITGKSKTAEMANEILANVDGELDQLKKAAKSRSK